MSHEDFKSMYEEAVVSAYDHMDEGYLLVGTKYKQDSVTKNMALEVSRAKVAAQFIMSSCFQGPTTLMRALDMGILGAPISRKSS